MKLRIPSFDSQWYFTSAASFLSFIHENKFARGGFTHNLNKGVLDELEKEGTLFLELYSMYVFLRETGDTEGEAFDKVRELKPYLADMLDRVVSEYGKQIVH